MFMLRKIIFYSLFVCVEAALQLFLDQKRKKKISTLLWQRFILASFWRIFLLCLHLQKVFVVACFSAEIVYQIFSNCKNTSFNSSLLLRTSYLHIRSAFRFYARNPIKPQKFVTNQLLIMCSFNKFPHFISEHSNQASNEKGEKNKMMVFENDLFVMELNEAS